MTKLEQASYVEDEAEGVGLERSAGHTERMGSRGEVTFWEPDVEGELAAEPRKGGGLL